jgi:hypothetical protein
MAADVRLPNDDDDAADDDDTMSSTSTSISMLKVVDEDEEEDEDEEDEEEDEDEDALSFVDDATVSSFTAPPAPSCDRRSRLLLLLAARLMCPCSVSACSGGSSDMGVVSLFNKCE